MTGQPHKKKAQRSCVACGQTSDKVGLIRFVRTPAGTVEVDRTGKAPGRGAYLCPAKDCFETARKRRALSRALKTTLGDDEYASLEREFNELCASRAQLL